VAVSPTRETVRFGLFELDPAAAQLTRNGRIIRLPQQPLRLLSVLLESPGHIVTREQLRQRLWPSDVFIDFDHGLNKSIQKLRHALGDSADSPRYIETIPRVGYRFIAPVSLAAPADQAERTAKLEPDTQDPQPQDLPAAWPAIPIAGEQPGFERRPVEAPDRAFPTRRAFLWTAAAAVAAGGGAWLRHRSLERRIRPSPVSLDLPLGSAAADPGRLLGPPVIAPDGSAVVVSLSTEAGNSLFIRRLDTDRMVKIEGTQNGVQPFWSPDSQHVGFFADAKLKRIPAIGGSTVVLCDAPEPRGGSWGQDGTNVFGLDNQALFQISESGGKSVPVTSLDKALGENSHRYPVFLPYGRSFLYFARTDDPEQRAIFLTSLDKPDRRERIARADGQFALGRDPEAGTYYLLTQQEGKIAAQLFDVNLGRLTGPPAILLDRAGGVSVSATGILALRTDEQMVTRLLWLDRTGKELGTLGEGADYWSVTLSPDGRSAATTKHDYLTGRFQVWVASLETGVFEPLPEHSFGPIWSRDSSILYYSDVRRRQFFQRKISSKEDELVMELPKDKVVTVTDVSPDRHFAAADFGTDSAHSQVAWIELNPNLHRAPSWQFADAYGPHLLLPSFSPDGKWLAFASQQTGNLEVYVIGFPPSNSGMHRISLDGGHAPRWRADGKELFFLAPDSSLMSVEMSPAGKLSGSSPKRLFHTTPRVESDQFVFDVSPDGQRFLLIDGRDRTGESEIEMILNWPSLLQK